MNELLHALDGDDESWVFMTTTLPNTTQISSSSSSS